MTCTSTRTRRPLTFILLAAALSLTACGGSSGGDVEGGSAVEGVDLSGVSLSVGSKEFTEQLVLGQIAVQALRAAGAEVQDKTNITGTSVVRAALESGEVDVYYEYTGTGWITILGNTDPVVGADAQFEAVKTADAANGITWFAPAEANNTFALAANPAAADELDVASISDYARVVNENPAAATLCSSAEFINRDDGLPGVAQAYGFNLPADQVIQLEPALVYIQVGQREPCSFAVVFATDGQVLNNALVVLEDDKMFFPPYNVAATLRTEVYSENAAAYDELFGIIAAELTDESLTALNAEVDVDGRTPADVAADFLTELGIRAG